MDILLKKGSLAKIVSRMRDGAKRRMIVDGSPPRRVSVANETSHGGRLLGNLKTALRFSATGNSALDQRIQRVEQLLLLPACLPLGGN